MIKRLISISLLFVYLLGFGIELGAQQLVEDEGHVVLKKECPRKTTVTYSESQGAVKDITMSATDQLDVKYLSVFCISSTVMIPDVPVTKSVRVQRQIRKLHGEQRYLSPTLSGDPFPPRV